MELTELQPFTYSVLFPPEWRTEFSDRCMDSVNEGGGRAYVLTEDGKNLSYAIVRSGEAVFLFTDPEKRGMGYATETLKRMAEISHDGLTVRFSGDCPEFPAMNAIMRKLRFTLFDKSRTFTAIAGETLRERMEETGLLKKKDFILGNGAVCAPFSQTDPAVLSRLSPLPEGTDQTLSFALYGNGELFAYTLVTRINGDTVSFERIGTVGERIGTGVVFAPLCRSLEAIISKVNTVRMNFTVGDRDTRLLELVRKLSKGLVIREVENLVFVSPKK